MPLLALTIEDFKGKEIDLILEKESKKLLDDESFFKSRAFIQFLWRNNIEIFQAKCKRTKVEKPSRQDSNSEEEVKANRMKEFNQITPA